MEAAEFLKNYDGPELNIMEICGSHTSAISKSGLRGLVSEKIHLISGPGCPVCVTPAGYIDKLIELGLAGNVIVTFGDMLKVPGSRLSLSEARPRGVETSMVFSPMDIIDMAQKNPDKSFVFAAVGFETTAPIYALLIKELCELDIKNVKLLTAVKTMPGAVEWLLKSKSKIDAFIAPGHVCAVTGINVYEAIAEKYNVPFAVMGFEPKELLMGLTGLVKNISTAKVYNYYPRAVTREGNIGLVNTLYEYFEKCSASWRGMGTLADTGLRLKPEYARFDAGSSESYADSVGSNGCRCAQVVTGQIMPMECPLFGKVCTPLSPKGACMVSEEGACNAYYEG